MQSFGWKGYLGNADSIGSDILYFTSRGSNNRKRYDGKETSWALMERDRMGN